MNKHKINHYISILLGLFFLGWQIYALFTGETVSLGSSGMSNKVTATENPVSYWVSICFVSLGGVLLIIGGLQRLKSNKTTKEKNPFHIEIK